ncbi:MAG: hypothetical protein ACRC1P_01895 [Cellulosilyticaceae bacterium]
MSKLLTAQELANHINTFRNILGNFDYSSIQNIRFLNLESFFSYMDHVEDNPFQKQYVALQSELDCLQPYLPFASAERASEFLTAMSKAKNDDETITIKKDFAQKLRNDFINLARTCTTDDQWQSIIHTFEEIRSHKEEMALAIN